MSDFSSAVLALEAALAGADNDKKINALHAINNQLQTESSATAVYEASSSLTPNFKAALKSSNGHVFLAALACLPPYFAGLGSPFDPDASVSSTSGDPPAGPQRLHALKQAVSTLASGSSGSVMTGLGDAKERTRETARTALVAAAHAAAGLAELVPAGGVNEALIELERIVKEIGFANKAARARAEICHYYTTIRLANPTSFPLRPYLPSLITLLEDPDPAVRSAAHDCIVAVFSASGTAAVSPAAKTELRKEMARQNVRKATVESILSKVLGGSTPNLEDVNGASRPGSSASVDPDLLASQVPSGPAGEEDEVPPFYVASLKDLDSELAKMTPQFNGKETEHNWQARESSILALRGMLRPQDGIALKHPADFVQALRTHGTVDGILKTLASLRTTLAVSTCSLLSAVATHLPSPGVLDPLANETFIPALFRMAPQTKKIVAAASQRAAGCFLSRAGAARDSRVLGSIEAMLGEKTVQARQSGIEHFNRFVSAHRKPLSTSPDAWWTVERCLKKSLSDANPGVKEAARKAFWTCHAAWPSQANALLGGLDAATRKAVDRANPNPTSATNGSIRSPLSKSVGAAAGPNGSGAAPKRTSVRSMIAATRAAQAAASSKPPVPATRSSASEFGRPSTPQRSVSAGNPAPATSARRPVANARPASFAASPLSRLSRSVPASASPVIAMGMTSAANGSARAGSPGKIGAMSPPLSKSPPRQSKLPRPSSGMTSPSLGAKLAVHEVRARASSASHSRSLSSGSTNEGIRSGRARNGSVVAADEPIVEEALKSNALQAVSAAERLLELVDPDDVASPPAPLGPGGVLLPNAGTSPPQAAFGSPSSSIKALQEPATPASGSAPPPSINAVSRWSAAFADSPAAPPPPALLGGLGSKDTGWYHRHADMVLGNPLLVDDDEVRRAVEDVIITRREPEGGELAGACKKLARIIAGRSCVEGQDEAVHQRNETFWSGRLFETLLSSLVTQLRAGEEGPSATQDSRLLLLRAVVVHLHPLLAGREPALFATLLHLRRAGSKNLVAGSEAIAVLAADVVDPLFGIGALRSGLNDELGVDTVADVDMPTAKAYALALRCLGRCLGRLPAAVLEDEVVRVRSLIMKALNDPHHADLRLAAVLCLVAIHAVLRDQQQLFALTGGLTPAQEALLMYYCNTGPQNAS